MNNSLTKCTKEKWDNAQKEELNVWLRERRDGEDWNKWWYKEFECYSFLTGRNIKSMLEVGCGPYAQNTKIMLDTVLSRDTVKQIDFLDPLLDSYIENKFSVTNLIDENTVKYSIPLEELNVKEKYDLVVCINVFDHAYDVDRCLSAIYDSLNNDGVVIIGQDLTDEEDLSNLFVVRDIMHPIKIDLGFLDKKLEKYRDFLFDRTLHREQGRNPPAHCGTLLYAGVK